MSPKDAAPSLPGAAADPLISLKFRCARVLHTEREIEGRHGFVTEAAFVPDDPKAAESEIRLLLPSSIGEALTPTRVFTVLFVEEMPKT